MPIRGADHVVHLDYVTDGAHITSREDWAWDNDLEDDAEEIGQIIVNDDLGTQEYVVDEFYDEKSVKDFEQFLALNSESKKNK